MPLVLSEAIVAAYAAEGSAGYREGDLQDWQEKTRPVLQNALGIKDDEKKAVMSSPDFKLYYLFKDDAIQTWEVSYDSFDGKKLTAYLLFPLKPEKILPSMILLHGHKLGREEAAFDNKSYMKGMGYKLAKRGFAVLVPQLRGFYNFEFQHNRYIKKLKRNFTGMTLLDIIKAQTVLENLQNTKVGFSVDTTKNGVMGMNYGGLASLVSGSLDNRFEFTYTQDIFVGFEELFSSRYHACYTIPALGGVLNVDDVALLTYPRRLYIAAEHEEDIPHPLMDGLKQDLGQNPACALLQYPCSLMIENPPENSEELLDQIQKILF